MESGAALTPTPARGYISPMADAAYVGAPRPDWYLPGYITFARQTGFYPLYDGENDQVDRVSRVLPVRFQRVVPRYRLSGSETSDTGLGPSFYDVPVYAPSLGARQVPDEAVAEAAGVVPPSSGRGGWGGSARPVNPGSAPLHEWQGTRVDLLV